MGEKPRRDDVSRNDPATRPPYVAPDIAWEDELGARPGLVSACGKVGDATEACQLLPSGS